MYLLVSSFFLLLFYISTKLIFYKWLTPVIGILDSYLLDQLFFGFLFFIIFLRSFLKKKISISCRDINVLLLFTIFAFITLSELLKRYPIGDDLFVMLEILNQPESLEYKYISKLDYYYYHFLGFSLLYRVFDYGFIYYNVFSIFTMGLAAAVFYKLLNYLSKLRELKSKLLSIIITIFVFTSPNITGHFRFMEHGVAIGYIAVMTIVSIYFYLKFLYEPKSRPFFFILSYVAMLFLLKTSLTRIAFLPGFFILLELVYLSKIRKRWIPAIARMALIFIPFYLMAGSYFLPSSSGPRLYSIGLERFMNFDRLYLFSASLYPFLIPYQFLPRIMGTSIDFVKSLGPITTETKNFYVYNNFFFVTGLFTYIISFISLLFLYLKKVKIKLIFVFWVLSLMSIAFYTLAGYGENVKISRFDYGLTHYSQQFSGAGYPLLPLMFLSVTIYLVLSKLNGKAYYVINFLFFILLIFNIKFTKSVLNEMGTGPIIYKTLVENVLTLVPDDYEDKVLYSTSGKVPVLAAIGVGDVKWFYKHNAPRLIIDKDELINYLQENQIHESNFYAFSFNENFLAFNDESMKERKEMSEYLR